MQGSGKTLLASCVSALATGHTPEIWPHTAGRDDEETRKRLFAALRDGTTALIWDNITGVFNSAALAAAISAVLRDRVLGRSESLSIPNRALLLLTGNNLCPAGDLPRRIIPIRIDPGTDAPFARQFDLDPLDYVLDHRIEIACAALVLIRGRAELGRGARRGTHGELRGLGRSRPTDGLLDRYWTRAGRIRRSARTRRARPRAAIPSRRASSPCWQALDAVFASALVPGEGSLPARCAGTRGRTTPSRTRRRWPRRWPTSAGERSLASTKSIGRVLRFREGRIVFGLRLLPGPAGAVKIPGRGPSENPIGAGLAALAGINSRHLTGAGRGGTKSKQAESNPPNPLNPQSVGSNSTEGR